MDNAQRAAKLRHMAEDPLLETEAEGAENDTLRAAADLTPDARRHRQAEGW
jgi:hypothetical protein